MPTEKNYSTAPTLKYLKLSPRYPYTTRSEWEIVWRLC